MCCAHALPHTWTLRQSQQVWESLIPGGDVNISEWWIISYCRNIFKRQNIYIIWKKNIIITFIKTIKLGNIKLTSY